MPYTLPPVVHSPMVGQVVAGGGVLSSPQFAVTGDFANPAWWTCGASGGTTTPYVVTCTPQPGTLLDWHCSLLSAFVLHGPSTLPARTSLDCDGGAPEAQAQAPATGGQATQAATSGVAVSAFTCTVDNGFGGPVVGGWFAICGGV